LSCFWLGKGFPQTASSVDAPGLYELFQIPDSPTAA
jgi:hypothetical protein